MLFKTNPDYIFSSIKDEMVLLNKNNGKYFKLNQSSALIWKELQNCNEIKELETKVTQKFPSEKKEEIVSDINSFIEQAKKFEFIIEVK